MNLTSLFAAAATTGVLVLAPGPTAAGSATTGRYSHLDPRGDLGQVDVVDGSVIPEPTRTEGDITALRVSHFPRHVRVGLSFRRLDRVGVGHLFGAMFSSPRGHLRVMVESRPGDLAGIVTATDRAGRRVRCSGIRHSVDHARDRVVISVPRRCLARPAAVRVLAYAATFDDHDLYVDDALTSEDWSGTHWTPRIPRA